MGLKSRLDLVEDAIRSACHSVGRDRASVTLVAVSKTVDIEQIQAAYDLGIRHFGESRLQEALPKIEALPSDIIWHYIGRIQTNKARRIAESFSVIHAIDEQKQLEFLSKADRPIDGLISVNLDRESQKSGVFTENLDELVKSVIQCNSVRFRGLMTIGRATTDIEESRTLFRTLAEQGALVGAEWLSMGMTADFAVAIQEGSTHIRVGSAIFGDRA